MLLAMRGSDLRYSLGSWLPNELAWVTLLLMPIVFDQEIHVHYGQFYVQDQTPFETEMNESFGAQANGLCGAAVPGLLFLITGLHTGQTRVTIEVLDARPHRSAMSGRRWSRPRSGQRLRGCIWCSGPARRAGRCRSHRSTTGSGIARPVWTGRGSRTHCSKGNPCWTDTCCSYGPLRPLLTRSSARLASRRRTGTPTPARCHRHPLRRNERTAQLS